MVTAADDPRLAASEAKLDDVQEGQEQILVRLDAFDARFDTTQHEINSRFDRLHIAIWTVGGGIIVTLISLLIAQVIQGSS